jgi:isoleucyl-tRNA synthetase
MFRSVATSVNFPALEAEILRFWEQRQVYQKSLQQRAAAPPFIFYEGPPTANGLPHPGHCLTRAIKDLFPRYRTMRGYRCDRKAGWDTHGLPVEVEVCKELGIHSKEEIEAFGIEPFIHRCQQSVWRYMQEWERLTQRIGFWVDLDQAYVTYHQSYVESVWWSLKNLFDRGLLYQGHKIVWWWAQGGTALSAGEVGQGYREVADPSVYVKFPIVVDELAPDRRLKTLGLDANTSLLVWTTTPWTLPGNQFAAVSPTTEYCLIRDEDGSKLILASPLLVVIKNKVGRTLEVIGRFNGCELVDLRYRPPFDGYYEHMADFNGDLRATPPGLQSRRDFWIDECGLAADDADRRIRQHDEFLYWRVVAGTFVTTDSGTGIVHVAPAFGEEDFDVLLKQRKLFAEDETLELFCPVNPDGTFTADATKLCHGRWVKDCDKDIIRDLKRRGLLFHQEQYLHDYPFCWRAEEDPLIQYPRESWFIRTSQFKDEMLANNARINWLPEHIRDGRFGNFLEANVDWALSRERYWGTPLPIWVCEWCGKPEAISSYDELLAKPNVQGVEVWEEAKRAKPDLSEHLKVHKPYIDAITYDSPCCAGKRMRRVPEVIDCWYDSGAMPFAQWGYPHQGREQFASQFPADFISEALDQTRGWFYSQLAISTLLFGTTEGGGRKSESGGQNEDSTGHQNVPPSAFRLPHFPYPHPFRNCIVLGLMLGEDGQKMSKSKRNYREPSEIFDRYGADALRWYFFANQPPWTGIRYNEQAIKDSIPEFLLRLWNVYSFLVIYAQIDGFDPAARLSGMVGQLAPEVLSRASGYRPIQERNELDRWIASELHRTAAAVVERMDAYDNFAACSRITAFVDALSNWYVRRSRDRFWSGEHSADKLDAYWTLYECLVTTARLVAPFVPFVAEALWQNLVAEVFGARAVESVHLCDFPTGDAAVIDQQLSQEMELVREIVSLGRSARMGAKLKVRQPLAKVEIILADSRHQAWLADHAPLIAEELNVKKVEFALRADQYINYSVLPDLKRLGPRLGKQLPALKGKLAQLDAAKLLAEMESQGSVAIELPDGPVTLDMDDLQVRLQAKEGWAAAQGPAAVVVLATEITPDLAAEGWARELVHAVQNRRRDLECQYTDRIALGIVTPSDELRAAFVKFADYIKSETLALEMKFGPIEDCASIDVKIAEHEVELYVQVARRE